MKLIHLAFMALVAALSPLTVMAQLPGPVMSENAAPGQLPQAAQAFIGDFYGNTGIAKCEFEPGRGGGYEVTLANGVEIDFNSRGEVTGISAPDDYALPQAVVNSLLPQNARTFLQRNSLGRQVESIDFEKDGIEVEFTCMAPDKVLFSRDGKFRKLERD